MTDAASPVQRTRSRADARRLWSCVLDLVTDPANQLPAPLRGQIASLALWLRAQRAWEKLRQAE